MNDKAGAEMRVIIRFSIDNEKGSALRNKLHDVLIVGGFLKNKNTATYENGHIEVADMADVLGKFWSVAQKHKGTGRVDHFWMYTDRTLLSEILE